MADDDSFLNGSGEVDPEQQSASYGFNTSAGPFNAAATLSGQEYGVPSLDTRLAANFPEGFSTTLSRSGQVGDVNAHARNAIEIAKQFDNNSRLGLEASRMGDDGPLSYGAQLTGQIGRQGGPKHYYPEPQGHWQIGAGMSPGERHITGGAKFNFANGGHIDAALHAARQHFEGGGLSDLFSGPDIMSTGNAPSPGDWGNPEVGSDFFKADKAALALAKQAAAPDDDVTGSIPTRRAPAPVSIAAPAPAPAPDVDIPFSAPDKPYLFSAAQAAPAPDQPLAYTDLAPAAPAQTAIDTAMTAAPKLTGRAAPQPGMTDLTPQQTDYIIRTIAAESSGNPEESQGIANVIMNRINSGRFGPTPEHVLFSKNQFEPWSNKSLANYPLKIKPDSDRYQAAAGALDAALQGEDNTGGATYFWGPGSQYARGRNTPSWANKFPDYTDIGATRFHREGRADGGETNGDKNMTHRHIIDHALHVLRRHFDGSDGSYVDPMGNVAYGDNTDYRDVPGYGPIEAASIAAGKAGATVGEPLRKGSENYINNVHEALREANEYARQGMENTVSDKGPLYNVSGPLQYGLGIGGMFASPLTGAIKSGEQAATELTGNPEIGSRFGAVAGVMDPTHVGALKAAPELATILGKTSQTVSEASPYAAMAAIPGMRGKITKATDLPSIRDLPVDDAIEIARREQHLIPTEAGNPNSGFVGGPRDIENKRQLNQLRKNFDTYIGADPRGGDWYDRYRAAVNSVTGGDPTANAWMAAQEGQWSAGVSPQSELAFALKENNASIAGMPVKAARPAQFEAHNRAIEMQDPNEMQLGKKTGEYARLINPDQFTQPGATGVNDFRHARNFNYTEAGGDAQRAALTGTQHSFLDYETALAVDRANKANLAGRSNWTGEQLQAAPWVRQKALDILDQRPNLTKQNIPRAKELFNNGYGSNRGMTVESIAKELAYEDAFQDANSTIGDAFDKHTAFATHEAQPGSVTQHLPGSVGASQEERNAFAADPRSSWAFAPGNRDAIYSGLGIPGTGVSMRVRPTNQMQGMYTTPSGVLETNPGEVARPLVAFQSGEAKSVAPADRSLLNAGEATRAYIDAQNAGAWHKPWAGGAPKLSNSYFLPMDRPATVDELVKMREGLAPHGLNDIVDTGQGITATSFYPGAPELSRDARAQVERAIELARPEGSTGAQRVKIQPGVDTGYLSYEDEFANPGSGDATRALLKQVNQTPGIRQAFNLNADIPQKALNNLARDEEWANKWGATRDDIQRSRRIIGEGPGWIDRLETALKNGAVLPAIGAALLAPLVGRQDNGG